MALTIGTGPLAGGGAPHILDEPRRLRAVLGDRVVLDSTRAKLVFAPRAKMTPCVPREDVADGVVVEEAPVTGHVTLVEEDAQWFLEEERVFGHLRDPYHRVDVVEASRPAAVIVAGTTIASTPRAKLLYETSLPLRVYVPPASVEAGVLTPSDKRTHCPYKGEANYWHVTVDGRCHDDAAWSYETALPESIGVRHHVCFLADGIVTRLEEPTQRFTL
ncbi:MAG TPA: DUF427 domain-containing protein [Solirubrobacteraceae bacterium]|nr:DUF427 domain-containing protein [Solirubrobacteraceae bacterium]